MFRGTRAIWKREMRKWYRNRTQLISSLLLPVLFLIIVGNVYSGSFSHVQIAIISNDTDIPAQIFVQRLQNSTTFDVVGLNNITAEDAKTMVDDGSLDGFIIIPENFSSGFLPVMFGGVTGPSTQVNVTVDNTNFLVAQALPAAVATILNDTLHDPQVASWYSNQTAPLHLNFTLPMSTINTINQYSGPDYKFIDFIAPGILAMTVLFTSLFAAGMPVMLDREVGYFDMLLTTPVPRSDLVLGFTFAGVTKVVAQATFVFIIAILLGIHMSLSLLSILSLYLLVILLALGFVGISIALSVKIELTAFQFVNGLINFPVFFLSGAFYPVQSLPEWLRVIVQLNPMTYAVHAMRAVMIKGTSLMAVLPDLGVVAIFALLTQLLGNFMLLAALAGKQGRTRRKKPPNLSLAVNDPPAPHSFQGRAKN